MLAVAVVLKRQRVPSLADALWTSLGYREVVDDAWAGKKLGDRVQLSEALGLGLNLDNSGVSNLRPIEGIPFAHLSLTACPVEDLQPLRGMPLVRLRLGNTRVSDLTPLEGMQLVEITLPPGEPRGLDLLRKRKSLEKINGVPAAVFWKQHDGREPRRKLLERYRNHLDVTWPGKKVGSALRVNKAGGFELHVGSAIADLKPLKGMPLVLLNLYGAGDVRDLSPLKGRPLVDLNLHLVQAKDLSPLKGMPLKKLFLWLSAAVDLRPLEGMPLTSLVITQTGVTDLTPLRGMPLNYFEATATNVTDIAPLRGMPLATLHLGNTKVANLTPLEGMKLVEITLPPGTPRGLELLRKMKSLEKINGMPAAEFWKQYDARKK